MGMGKHYIRESNVCSKGSRASLQCTFAVKQHRYNCIVLSCPIGRIYRTFLWVLQE